MSTVTWPVPVQSRRERRRAEGCAGCEFYEPWTAFPKPEGVDGTCRSTVPPFARVTVKLWCAAWTPRE